MDGVSTHQTSRIQSEVSRPGKHRPAANSGPRVIASKTSSRAGPAGYAFWYPSLPPLYATFVGRERKREKEREREKEDETTKRRKRGDCFYKNNIYLENKYACVWGLYPFMIYLM